ncbi:P-loop containing nucleoside triphosphate hydrolase protein [Dactylonectria macrodidyma]|uniref:P-loop containing nucleoside triphosphate hydrolase protein n=1 Tax=Dactylonectria macrodidyma TaxID=307937 RepID=A0A9P9JLX2_9HYPO|nr:P-loop containing nucleoside triphosphate hydrolase protein [Dactylonectria macrodidyma]
METGQNHFFVNRVSEVHQEEPPDSFYGGIIGDPMGLGKTLTIIALVATDNLSNRPKPEEQTLIVVPPALLSTWEEQLSVESELVPTPWQDEACKRHFVSGYKYCLNNIQHGFGGMEVTHRWQQVCSVHQVLEACGFGRSRWAVTGTPIQNRLSDLAALLHFLRVDPYMDRKQFDSEISNVWKGGDTDEAIKRLKRLAGCLILRRKRTTISLPPRRDLQCPVEFTVAEREVYNEIRNQVISRIDYLIYENNGYDRSSGTNEASIVFSTWRTTLDVLEAGLNKASIKTLRFDGKVPQKDRQNVLDRFRTDPNVRVLLLTLSCGAVGLTLTAASHAFLMEPHWNPTLEDQALARIHRLGQKREVTTVRFYVRDSFEQRVIEVQESKRQLAGVLLSPHDSSSESLDMRSLQVGYLNVILVSC